jgi:hypothetical protein
MGENSPGFFGWELRTDDGDKKDNERQQEKNLYGVINEKVEGFAKPASGLKR